jgi:hypothetical protein
MQVKCRTKRGGKRPSAGTAVKLTGSRLRDLTAAVPLKRVYRLKKGRAANALRNDFWFGSTIDARYRR